MTATARFGVGDDRRDSRKHRKRSAPRRDTTAPSWAEYSPDDGGNPANNRSKGNRPLPSQRASSRRSFSGARRYGKRGNGR